ncbi:rod shape-determining protein MreC [Novosphingobium beihaiensis]|uniref:Cell shape-determining protein MreC n=1 Tax=Novosphingobium beihaiensis TaxID=2930389 RepID=A0ABT0BMY2_9SPHN|nr:rod shape-determining protein MreC [Novosphingobium beihaiensis]MCJ2186412.1 rod shape-determining protein MreC [Novosphingobium beihaiensis]
MSYTAGAVAVVVGLVLLALSIVSPGAFASVRSAAADVTAPAGDAAAVSRSFGRHTVDSITGFFTSGREHARLKRELAEAKVRLVEAEATAAENRRLKKLLGLKGTGSAPVAFARLTRSTSASARRFAIVNAGRNDGLAKGMPVRSSDGLIGRILETGASSARVLLITDTESLVPVRRATDGVPAFAQGNGDGTIRIRLINLGINPLKNGDVMVSSGSGGLYRPGTPMAIVTKILRDGATARVLANPSDTDFVMVEHTWAPKETPPPASPKSGGR